MSFEDNLNYPKLQYEGYAKSDDQAEQAEQEASQEKMSASDMEIPNVNCPQKKLYSEVCRANLVSEKPEDIDDISSETKTETLTEDNDGETKSDTIASEQVGEQEQSAEAVGLPGFRDYLDRKLTEMGVPLKSTKNDRETNELCNGIRACVQNIKCAQPEFDATDFKTPNTYFEPGNLQQTNHNYSNVPYGNEYFQLFSVNPYQEFPTHIPLSAFSLYNPIYNPYNAYSNNQAHFLNEHDGEEKYTTQKRLLGEGDQNYSKNGNTGETNLLNSAKKETNLLNNGKKN